MFPLFYIYLEPYVSRLNSSSSIVIWPQFASIYFLMEGLIRKQAEKDQIQKGIERLHHPYIGALVSNFESGLRIGTGTLIAENLVLTCAHNIYDKAQKRQYNGIKFYFGVNGKLDDPIEIQAWRYPQGFIACDSNDRLKFDYAIIKLKKSVPGNYFPKVTNPCQQWLKSENQELQINICGYPTDSVKKIDENYYLYQIELKDKGRLSEDLIGPDKIGYEIRTSQGYSGSPIIINRTIIGIHTGSALTKQGKLGRMITCQIFSNLKSWFRQLKINNVYVQDRLPEFHPQTIDVECWDLLSQKSLTESEKVRELLRTINRQQNVIIGYKRGKEQAHSKWSKAQRDDKIKQLMYRIKYLQQQNKKNETLIKKLLGSQKQEKPSQQNRANQIQKEQDQINELKALILTMRSQMVVQKQSFSAEKQKLSSQIKNLTNDNVMLNDCVTRQRQKNLELKKEKILLQNTIASKQEQIQNQQNQIQELRREVQKYRKSHNRQRAGTSPRSTRRLSEKKDTASTLPSFKTLPLPQSIFKSLLHHPDNPQKLYYKLSIKQNMTIIHFLGKEWYYNFVNKHKISPGQKVSFQIIPLNVYKNNLIVGFCTEAVVKQEAVMKQKTGLVLPYNFEKPGSIYFKYDERVLFMGMTKVERKEINIFGLKMSCHADLERNVITWRCGQREVCQKLPQHMKSKILFLSIMLYYQHDQISVSFS